MNENLFTTFLARVKAHLSARHMIAAAVITLTAVFHMFFAVRMENHEPDDSVLYLVLAKNVLHGHGLSLSGMAPYQPSIGRLPFYPFFIAIVFRVFGESNQGAVLMLQGLVHSVSALLAGYVAYLWSGRQSLRAGVIAYLGAAFCPFLMIYSALILSETWTVFFMVLLALAATFALEPGAEARPRRWIGCGLVAGMAQLVRPEIGVVAGGVGLTGILLAYRRWRRRGPSRIAVKGLASGLALYAVTFALVLVPWTLRNWVDFHIFQPLVPRTFGVIGKPPVDGYEDWLNTWIVNGSSADGVLWPVDQGDLRIEDFPARAFASDAERRTVAGLLGRYHDGSAGVQNKMTPELQAEFEKLAQEHILRAPLRCRFLLPVARMYNMWFTSHSEFYPWDGFLAPLSSIGWKDAYTWKIVGFLALVWVYTAFAMAGLRRLIFTTAHGRRWAVLVLSLTLPRLIVVSQLASAEPRYVVEYFLFAAILAGIACIKHN